MGVGEVESFVTSLYLYGRVSNKRPERKQGPLKTKKISSLLWETI